MSYIIDRRLNGRHKSTVNRQRFLDRYKTQIRESVADAASKRSITDMERGESVSLPTKDISEPIFHHGSGGSRSIIHPGNKEFVTGDKIQRPQGGGGGQGSGKASNQGEGEDDFNFTLTQEEFLNFLFEDLALPNLVKRRLMGIETWEWQNAGIVSEGNPAKINIVRSLRAATSRRIALGAGKRRQIHVLQEELDELLAQPQLSAVQHERVKHLQHEIHKLRVRLEKIPFIDTFDLRYNHHIKVAKPTAQAVMFCIMDVSGSMSQATKDMAKRFFLLLYLFLKRNYKKIELVFIRHHTSAKEVDEQEFFYSRETGGTIVSSALKLMNEVITTRYPAEEWNIYAAQASDGDNWSDDSPLCQQILCEQILPHLQYFSYIEITPRQHQALWHSYEEVLAQFPEHFAMQQIVDGSDIYPVFRELFARKPA